MTSPRDRDEAGRPRNARPRDALGRPLPRGATPEYVEEALPQDAESLLRIGIEHFNAGRYFQAHEAWETAWHPSAPEERDFWQGITQVAVGLTHDQRGNRRGAVTLLRRGAARLAGYGERHRGIRVEALREAAAIAADAIERDGTGAPREIPTIAIE